MNYKSILKDVITFPVKNWVSLIILGLVYFIVHILYELELHYPVDLFDLAIISPLILLWIVEMGFFFRIVEETIKGSKIPPKFNNLKELLIHGFNANVVLLLYSFILIAFYALLSSDMIGFMTNDLSGFIQLYRMNPEGIYTDKVGILTMIVVTSISGLIYLFYLVGLVNMANNNGTIRAGLDIKAIARRIKKIKAINLIILYLYLDLITTIIFALLEYIIDFIPIHIAHFTLSSIIISFLIFPYASMLAFRLLGLFDKSTGTLN